MSAAHDGPASVPLAADYFDGRTSTRRAAVIEARGEHLCVRGEFGERHVALDSVEIGEAVGTAPRRITLADGAYCEVADGPAFAQWLRAAGHTAGLVERVQQRWRWVVLSLGGVVAALVVGYVWLLPLVAQAVAPRIPPTVTEAISRNALRALDSGVLRPSALPEQRRDLIRAKVARIADGGTPYRLEFRAAGKTANAFALPNGDIVVFDGLVKLAADDDEITAVVAHELGHVAHRHGWRQLIQASVVSAAVGFYFGDISSIATGLASLALESKYSREFELKADRFAADLLLAHGMSPELLATMLERLEAATHGDAGVDLLSSHPETAERVDLLRRRAPH